MQAAMMQTRQTSPLDKNKYRITITITNRKLILNVNLGALMSIFYASVE